MPEVVVGWLEGVAAGEDAATGRADMALCAGFDRVEVGEGLGPVMLEPPHPRLTPRVIRISK